MDREMMFRLPTARGYGRVIGFTPQNAKKLLSMAQTQFTPEQLEGLAGYVIEIGLTPKADKKVEKAIEGGRMCRLSLNDFDMDEIEGQGFGKFLRGVSRGVKKGAKVVSRGVKKIVKPALRTLKDMVVDEVVGLVPGASAAKSFIENVKGGEMYYDEEDIDGEGLGSLLRTGSRAAKKGLRTGSRAVKKVGREMIAPQLKQLARQSLKDIQSELQPQEMMEGEGFGSLLRTGSRAAKKGLRTGSRAVKKVGREMIAPQLKQLAKEGFKDIQAEIQGGMINVRMPVDTWSDLLDYQHPAMNPGRPSVGFGEVGSYVPPSKMGGSFRVL